MTDEVEVDENEDAETEDGEEQQDDAPKSKKKLFIIIGAAVVLVLALGGGAYFFLLGGSKGGDEMYADVTPTYFYDMRTMTVNLSTDGEGGEQFLKLSVSLELANEDMLAVIEPRMVRVRDAFQVYLRELRRSDLEGSAGIYRLKEELRRRVNLAIYPAQVDSILFKEILVQ